MTAKHTEGRGARGLGTCPATGHYIGFGNTEEECRIKNLGCAARGRLCDGPVDSKTGKGFVAAVKGEYHDALHVKKNRVEILLNFAGWAETDCKVARWTVCLWRLLVSMDTG